MIRELRKIIGSAAQCGSEDRSDILHQPRPVCEPLLKRLATPLRAHRGRVRAPPLAPDFELNWEVGNSTSKTSAAEGVPWLLALPDFPRGVGKIVTVPPKKRAGGQKWLDRPSVTDRI